MMYDSFKLGDFMKSLLVILATLLLASASFACDISSGTPFNRKGANSTADSSDMGGTSPAKH